MHDLGDQAQPDDPDADRWSRRHGSLWRGCSKAERGRRPAAGAAWVVLIMDHRPGRLSRCGSSRCTIGRFAGGRSTLLAVEPAVSPLSTDPGPMAGPPGLRAFRLLDDALRQGRYLPGDRLPPERDLARGLGISRTSLRQALTALAENGRVRAAANRGWYVLGAPISEGPNGFVSFSAQGRSRGLAATARILLQRVRPATLEEADVLGLPPTAPILDLERLRSLDGVPICVSLDRMPAARVAPLVERDLDRPLADRRAGGGLRPGRHPLQLRGGGGRGRRAPGRAPGRRARHAPAGHARGALRPAGHAHLARSHRVPRGRVPLPRHPLPELTAMARRPTPRPTVTAPTVVRAGEAVEHRWGDAVSGLVGRRGAALLGAPPRADLHARAGGAVRALPGQPHRVPRGRGLPRAGGVAAGHRPGARPGGPCGRPATASSSGATRGITA